MEIIVGKTAGFCFGVKNAVDNTYEQLKNSSNLYCLGELVHNERIINTLKENGLKQVEHIEDVPDFSKVIIRAHGINKFVYEIASKKQIELIDLTCPKVKHIHDIAREYEENNYYIILIAENKHPETLGTISFCGKNSCIVEEMEDIEFALNDLAKSNLDKVLIIAQTTFGMEKFKNIVQAIKEKTSLKIEVKNTICDATAIRQAETMQLSKKVDAMIIIGGKNSANTRRLYDISISNCKNVILIQNKDDEDLKEFMKNNYETVGVMAGASTPDESIKEIVDYLKK